MVARFEMTTQMWGTRTNCAHVTKKVFCVAIFSRIWDRPWVGVRAWTYKTLFLEKKRL